MWFWLSIATLIFWSGSDIFSKIGCADGKDPYSHLKMIMAVGAVMGIHAAYSLIFGHVLLDFGIILTYLPISLLYILSMLLGYIGLRYIELSVSSPICNSSGAVVAVLCLATGTLDLGAEGSMRILLIGAVALICLGVVGLGIVESVEDDELRMQRQKSSNFKYTKSWKAVCLPIAYCLLDAAGTFSDGIVLTKINEDSANCAYEFTFLFAALLAFVYVVLIKKQKLLPKAEAPKYIGALFETLGQFTYIHALSNEETVALSAPIISSYCALSAVWGHIFLKERLSKKHYIMIALVLIGIILLGIFDI
ncbi:MAG: EamA family transporter [Clostridia bacterium]|nr:EamA family transporter [Clostridia bacterium]